MNTLETNGNIESLSKELKDVTMNQIDIFKLKNTITEIKNSLYLKLHNVMCQLYFNEAGGGEEILSTNSMKMASRFT